MDKYKQITPTIGQVTRHIRGESAVVRILNGGDRPLLIGSDIHPIHKGRAIDQAGRYRWRLDICTVAGDDRGITGEDTVTREKHSRWLWLRTYYCCVRPGD